MVGKNAKSLSAKTTEEIKSQITDLCDIVVYKTTKSLREMSSYKRVSGTVLRIMAESMVTSTSTGVRVPVSRCDESAVLSWSLTSEKGPRQKSQIGPKQGAPVILPQQLHGVALHRVDSTVIGRRHGKWFCDQLLTNTCILAKRPSLQPKMMSCTSNKRQKHCGTPNLAPIVDIESTLLHNTPCTKILPQRNNLAFYDSVKSSLGFKML